MSDSEDDADGWAVTSKVWKDRCELRVYFLDPEILQDDEWKVGYCDSPPRPMTINHILNWAGEWNKHEGGVPKFVKAESAEESDIRVSFSECPLFIVLFT